MKTKNQGLELKSHLKPWPKFLGNTKIIYSWYLGWLICTKYMKDMNLTSYIT